MQFSGIQIYLYVGVFFMMLANFLRDLVNRAHDEEVVEEYTIIENLQLVMLWPVVILGIILGLSEKNSD